MPIPNRDSSRVLSLKQANHLQNFRFIRKTLPRWGELQPLGIPGGPDVIPMVSRPFVIHAAAGTQSIPVEWMLRMLQMIHVVKNDRRSFAGREIGGSQD